jgi:hypothetical protein
MDTAVNLELGDRAYRYWVAVNPNTLTKFVNYFTHLIETRIV